MPSSPGFTRGPALAFTFGSACSLAGGSGENGSEPGAVWASSLDAIMFPPS